MNPNDSNYMLAVLQRLESLSRSGVTHIPVAPSAIAPPDLTSGPPMPRSSQPPQPSHQQRCQPQAQANQQQPSQPTQSQPARQPAPATSPAQPTAANPSGTVLLPYDESAGPLDDRRRSLNLLAAEVAQCQACKELAQTRTQTVFGVGDPHSRVVFLGEAPGADEDKQGVPFVGRAGKLLTGIIQDGMKIPRDKMFICNVLRCRPPGNRTPLPGEANCCRRFLDATLDIVQPEFMLCLGACAAQNLLQTKETIGSMRGKFYEYRGIQVVCTYHPAYLLRDPRQKANTWEDIKMLMRAMGLPIPGEK